MSFDYHLITNVGTLVHSPLARAYPKMLALAHIYNKHPDYKVALKSKMELGHRIILDNGAHEGIDIDLYEYAHVIGDLAPTVAVMTDLVGRSSAESRKQSFKLFDFIHRDHLEKTQYMYVPQGKSQEDVLEEYRWALGELDPNKFIIGLGQGYLCWVKEAGDENKEDTRYPMIEEVMAMDGAQDHEFHVLGARWSADMSNYAYYENITGIDTIKPVTCAQAGLIYPERPPYRCMDRESAVIIPDKLMDQNIRAFCNEYDCTHALP